MGKTFVALGIAWLSALCLLPVATHCDSDSYYEKYYAARRFVPLKRNAPLAFNVTLTVLPEDQLAAHERPALVGNLAALGEWQANRAVLLNRTELHNVWQGTLLLPQNSSVEYRYFVGAVARSGGVQIRRWESHVHPRSFNTTKYAVNRTDVLSIIDGERQLTRGWLQKAGSIVQLKVFREALQLEESTLPEDAHLRLRVQPVHPENLSPILSSATANVEYVRLVYSDSKLRSQPEFGVRYDQSKDLLMFHIAVDQLSQVAYQLQIYGEQQDTVRLLGTAQLQPQALAGSEGNLTLPLLSPLWQRVVGALQLEYLVVQPMVNGSSDFRTSFVNYWRHNWTELEIGHRGLGKSLSLTATTAAPLIENTLATMQAAGQLGADMVEFDVQLTSDLVPIIHHDYSIRVCIDSKTPTTANDLTEVLIKDITYEQLKQLKTYQVVNNKIIEYPAHDNVEQVEQRLFPTLQDFFKNVNLTVGFDIEIKWPQLKLNGVYESEQTIDKNLFVDRILQVVERHGCGRLNIIKSFDADLCTLLRFKQNMYPVLFLTSSVENPFVDPRTSTVEQSINFAQAFDLAGIVPNAVFIKADPSLVQRAKSQVPLMLLWGSDLKDRTSIDWFIQQGPNGVVYDRMDLWLPANKTSAFEAEDDLPEFFQLQCASAGKQRVHNATIESILSNVNLL
ncbi:glycerophosphocholine phosphodiesterase GPCPD1 [Drosophila sulfurigaster albostrigata]|uniref:glycerophosphocholine phosphodiesterase GPCPD1 n=1 Tax=Drosophila sulfurigaster albostrigata TaxID=89887 RepID=UPI002D218BE6|nr:glycerophosphocholine phosphodiesterase GPCPD1 [Drosophila sulfurigaster albostrigata]